MAYAYKNLRVTFGGQIFNGEDIWTNTIHVGYTDRDWEFSMIDPSGETTEQMIDVIKNWFSSRDAMISPYATLEWVKFSIVGRDGKYAADGDAYEYNETFDFAPVSGGANQAGDGMAAPQLTVAITLESTVLRGAGRYGRIYPPLSGNVNSSGYDSNTASRATAAKTLVDGINDVMNSFLPDTDPAVIVASSVGDGRNAKVKAVKVGNVIDTQRRRRNAMREVYITEPVAGFQIG